MSDDGSLDAPDDSDDRAALEALLEVDEASDTWTFDEVSVDTGRFGRFVETGVVEKAGSSYRLADPDAVRSAIENGHPTGDGADSSTRGPSAGSLADSVDASSLSSDRLSAVVSQLSATRLPTVVGVLAVVALFVWTRAYIYPGVFRDGNVVLTANDPYAYRFLVESLTQGTAEGVSFETTGEPLFVATMWLGSVLLGGGQDAVGLVLAWYPVVAALFTGAVVYLIGARVLRDGRVGAVAAVSLALVPGYAFRTSLGFGDHHAFDYLWVTATVAVLAWTVTVETDDPFATENVRSGALLGLCLAAQTLAWEGSPLLLLPVAGYLAVAVPFDVEADRPPLRANAPVLLGTGVAAVVVLSAHLALGWQRLEVAVVPVLLVAGGLGVAGVGEFVRRRELSPRAVAATEVGGPVVGLVVLSIVLPSLVQDLVSGILFLLFDSNIAEKESAFTAGRAFGLELLGPFVLLALPVLFWGTLRAILDDRQWLALSVYGWWLLFLTVLQLRFAGHLAPLLALFSGIFIVRVLARFDLTAVPTPVGNADGPNRENSQSPEPDGRWFAFDSLTIRSGVATLVVVALVVGVSGFYLPDEVEGGVVGDEAYQTATWIGSYADEQGLSYPENYVFSRWGVNRMYNYFANGESRSYGRAQNNYRAFVFNDSSTRWYDQLENDTGFVVIEALPRQSGTIQRHLYITYGSRWSEEGYDAVSHYRAVYASSSTQKKVFTLVPGARITGTAPPNTTVEARTTVEIPNDSFLYRQQDETGADGEYRLVVPYPAEYEVTAGNETWSVSVSENAVQNGTTVRASG